MNLTGIKQVCKLCQTETLLLFLHHQMQSLEINLCSLYEIKNENSVPSETVDSNISMIYHKISKGCLAMLLSCTGQSTHLKGETKNNCICFQ